MTRRGARPVLWVALVLTAAWGGVSAWRRAHRATQVLATTTCPLFGAPRVTMSASVAAEDTQPVRIHEEVHAAQCRALGALRYWVRNLSANGKLGLEAPAYCAAAQARVRAGQDPARVRERLLDDITEALSDVVDSTTVGIALREHCPELASAR